MLQCKNGRAGLACVRAIPSFQRKSQVSARLASDGRPLAETARAALPRERRRRQRLNETAAPPEVWPLNCVFDDG